MTHYPPPRLIATEPGTRYEQQGADVYQIHHGRRVWYSTVTGWPRSTAARRIRGELGAARQGDALVEAVAGEWAE
jgi:hypothetical protein